MTMIVVYLILWICLQTFVQDCNLNNVLCIKVKQGSGNSRESVCQEQAQYRQ